MNCPFGAGLFRKTGRQAWYEPCSISRHVPTTVKVGRLGGERDMLNLILVLLVLMWLAGMVTSYTLGGFLHLLLLLAVAVFLIRLIQGRNPVV